MEISYRYRKAGVNFIPQYKRDVNNEDWRDFVASDIPNGDLLYICQHLGELQLPQRWSCGVWYYKDAPNAIFFTKEIFCMAFLGAAKSFWSADTKEFNL